MTRSSKQIIGRGMIICLEGIDSTGKSYQANQLKHRLIGSKIFKHPNRESETGKILDDHLKKAKLIENPKLEHLLHCANQMENEDLIMNESKNFL